MIQSEFYTTLRDGTVLIRTYSDKGMCIRRDGIDYEEAIDPENLGRVYEETDIPISESQNEDEISAEEALSIITGGER